MDVEQDAASGDPGRDRDGAACKERSDPSWLFATEHERSRGVERRRGRRVAAREGRPEGLGDRVQIGPNTVGEVLDRMGENVLADDHHRQVADHPPRWRPQMVDNGEDDRGDDHEPGLPERRDDLQAGIGGIGRMSESPLGDALVQLDERVARAHEVGEHRQREPAEDDDPERQGEGQPGRDSRIEPLEEQTPKPGVVLERMAHRRSRSRRRVRRHETGRRKAPDHYGHDRSEREGDDEEQQDGHRRSSRPKTG